MSGTDSNQQAAAPAPPQTPSAPSNARSDERLDCQWNGCTESCVTPELLYDHICERHVGRKSTNNLNLTCQWGTCRTTTVKRDHITSHIRVHVPLKPHRCDFCGKSFKRPQDLKKHVKTHADDSVLLNSPGQDTRPQPPNHNTGYHDPKVDLQALAGAASGWHDGFHPGPAPYGHPVPPGTSASFYGPPTQGAGYGPVYYPSNPHTGAPHASYDQRTQNYHMSSLNDFFGDAKRGVFDPRSGDLGQRLMHLQQLQLPAPQGGMVPDYQAGQTMMQTMAAVPSNPYALPHFSNLRTKNDLLGVDNFIDQIQQAVMENPNQAAAAGIAQPGAHYAHRAMNFRTSQSPPQLPTDSTGPVANMGQATSQAPQTGTPALTPSSAFSSGHSPSTQGMSPTARTPSTAMYPNLPTLGSNTEGYPSASAATPSASLGTSFDRDGRRRYSGGILQKASRPSDEMSDGSITPEAASHASSEKDSITQGVRKVEISNDMIDPALSGSSQPVESDHMPQYADALRNLDWIKGYIHDRIQRGDYEDEAEPEPTHEDEADHPENHYMSAERKIQEVIYPSLQSADE